MDPSVGVIDAAGIEFRFPQLHRAFSKDMNAHHFELPTMKEEKVRNDKQFLKCQKATTSKRSLDSISTWAQICVQHEIEIPDFDQKGNLMLHSHKRYKVLATAIEDQSQRMQMVRQQRQRNAL